MAVIENRGAFQWRALVRRKGFAAYSRTFERQKDAQSWATDVEAAIGRRDLTEVRRLTGNGEELGGTVGALVDRYIEEVLPSRKHPQNERPRLNRIKSAFGRLALPMLTPFEVSRWRDQRLKDDGASLGTVRHDLNTLSKLLGHAVSEWGIEAAQNVVTKVKKPALAPGRDRRVSQQELDLLLRAARHQPEGRPNELPARGLAPLITLAVETSMRMGELVGLTWHNVDIKHCTISLHSTKTKNGEARTVGLSSTAILALRELKQVRRLDDRVFDWAARDSASHPFRRCVKRALALYQADCTASGQKPVARILADLRFHDLRHEATSRLFEKGLNPFEVASMTGHKSMQMLKRYTHVEAAKVAAKLG